MDLITQILVCIGAFAVIVVVGTFAGVLLATVEDIITEREQERERSKWRTKK